MNNLIYLASPYSHPNKAVQCKRYLDALFATAKMCLDGFVVFSPIVHSHVLHTDAGMQGDWGFWEKIDKTIIDHCDEVWVLMLEGWEESVGVNAEIRFCEDKGIPVRLFEWDGENYKEAK